MAKKIVSADKPSKKHSALANLEATKELNDLIRDDNKEDRYLSTNVMSCNILCSGKVRGGVKIGCITTCCADSTWGKSLIGYNVLKSAQKAGMECVIIDTENSLNVNYCEALGIKFKDKNGKPIIKIYQTSIISQIEQIYATLNDKLTRAERENVFVLFDSWGTLTMTKKLEAFKKGSDSADMGKTPIAKNELANTINAYNNTNFVINGVYKNIGDMYGEKFCVPGGGRLFFNSDAIMLCSSARKFKDENDNVVGKVITAGVKKGRGAKELMKSEYLIRHNGALDPFYGLLDNAIDYECVFKPKPGYYARTDYDVDKETGEVSKMWRESELYCPQFWIPLFTDEKFVKSIENEFSFKNKGILSASLDLFDLMDGKQAMPTQEELDAIDMGGDLDDLDSVYEEVDVGDKSDAADEDEMV